jgi:hypothetical protein
MGVRRSPSSGEVTVEQAKTSLANAQLDAAKTDVRLRKFLGYGALVLMAIQIVVADAAFWIYGFTNNWDIPVAGINVWLGATVIQVAVVVRTVAKYLFPSSGSAVTDAVAASQPTPRDETAMRALLAE